MTDVPYGFCGCGCGEKTALWKKNDRSQGRIKGEPKRFIKGHNNVVRSQKRVGYDIENRGYDTPCWISQLVPTKSGYASIAFGRPRRYVYAHRYFYERHVGPIPADLELDHLCRNRACVNPAHLEAVTHAENLRRASSGRRGA